jgi:hypothetical protein
MEIAVKMVERSSEGAGGAGGGAGDSFPAAGIMGDFTCITIILLPLDMLNPLFTANR